MRIKGADCLSSLAVTSLVCRDKAYDLFYRLTCQWTETVSVIKRLEPCSFSVGFNPFVHIQIIGFMKQINRLLNIWCSSLSFGR